MCGTSASTLAPAPTESDSSAAKGSVGTQASSKRHYERRLLLNSLHEAKSQLVPRCLFPTSPLVAPGAGVSRRLCLSGNKFKSAKVKAGEEKEKAHRWVETICATEEKKIQSATFREEGERNVAHVLVVTVAGATKEKVGLEQTLPEIALMYAATETCREARMMMGSTTQHIETRTRTQTYVGATQKETKGEVDMRVFESPAKTGTDTQMDLLRMGAHAQAPHTPADKR